MRHSVDRFARLFISASLVVAFMPVGTISAVGWDGVRSASASTQYTVSVVRQTTYTDTRGVRWVDAVVSNESARALRDVRVPVVFEEEGRPVPNELVVAEAQPYVLAPGAVGTFHVELDGDTPDRWEPVVESGTGAPVQTRAHALTVVSVEQVDDQAIVSASRLVGKPADEGQPEAMTTEPESAEGDPSLDEDPLSEDEPTDEDPAIDDEPEEGEDPGEDVDEAAAAVRTYRVEVRNDSTIALKHARVTGAENVTDGSGRTTLLDTVVSESWDMALKPGESTTLVVYGMAECDGESDGVSTDFKGEGLEEPVVKLRVLSAKPAYGSRVVLRATVSRNDGSALSGERELGIAWSVDGEEWETATFSTESGTVTKALVIDGALRCRAVFGMDGEFAEAESAELLVKPASEVSEPKAAASVRKGRAFTVSGLVKPDYAPGTRKVKLQFYRLEKSGWKLRKTVLTTTASYPGSYAKYSAKVKLPSAGKWKVRAFNPGDERAGSAVSGFDYVSVR